MQNKGYQTPYGQTVIPGAPPVVVGNGVGGHGPAGAPSSIPGTIGVAGSKATTSTAPQVLGNGLPGFEQLMAAAQVADKAARGPKTISELVGDAAIEALVDSLAERVAEKMVHKIASAMVAQLPALLPMLQGALGQPAQPPVESRSPIVPPAADMPPAAPFGAQPEAPVSNGGPTTIDSSVYGPQHDLLALAVTSAMPYSNGGSISILRYSPEPPGYRLTAGNGASVELVAYSAKYSNPRFPLDPPPNADALYAVVANGRRVYSVQGRGWFSADEVVGLMREFFENPPEVTQVLEGIAEASNEQSST